MLKKSEKPYTSRTIYICKKQQDTVINTVNQNKCPHMFFMKPNIKFYPETSRCTVHNLCGNWTVHKEKILEYWYEFRCCAPIFVATSLTDVFKYYYKKYLLFLKMFHYYKTIIYKQLKFKILYMFYLLHIQQKYFVRCTIADVFCIKCQYVAMAIKVKSRAPIFNRSAQILCTNPFGSYVII